MKKSDIMLVILIATVGVVAAYFLCDAMLPDIEAVSFKTIGAVAADLAQPDPEVFNSAALNPTVETYVGTCVDQDKNGELDLAESVLCMQENGGVKDDEDKTEGDNLQDILDQVSSEE